MNYESSVVYLASLPKLEIESGVDYPTLIGFAVTVFIFGLGTWLSVRTSNENSRQQTENLNKTLEHQERSINKTISSQESVAEKNSLKSSRQAWINDLRDTCSSFVSEALNVQRLNNYWESAKPSYAYKQKAEPELAHQMHLDWVNSHIQAMKEVARLKSKIELLLNPEEIDSKELLKAVTEAAIECDKNGGSANSSCQTVVEWCQHILKQEWEKAKAGK
ncbi:hypothetical protein [Pseudomonas sp. W2Jun17]|uniref:hypothetical protein n=1 Tax=Pseudomonas sp. W2Jun17 TaxID=1553460 RepID=UPI00200506D9|nr:hypothetical protein [Pseudomonas sp. W2Jun17]MCK3851537.1 hypothetical protein [Pseudomonas sp. W2Jun17]